MKKRYILCTALAAVGVLLALGVVRLSTGASGGQPVLTESERRWLGEHPEPRLGVFFHYPPYEIYNLDGRYEGLAAEYVRRLENRIGLRFRLVRCVNADDAARRFAAGEVDVLAAVTPDSGPAETALATKVYATVPAVIITRKEQRAELGLEDMEGMTAGLAVSEAFLRHLHRRFPVIPFATVSPQGGHIGGLRALSMGDFDALICDMAVASHYIATAGISNLRVAGTTGYEVSHFMAVRADMPVLRSILNKGLDAVTPSEREDIEKHWLGLHVVPLWQSRDFRLWALGLVGVLGGVFLLIFLWVYSLRAQVASRTALLSSINRVLMHSLGCRTEQEVLGCCLKEAATLSRSREAVYGHLEGDGLRVEALLTAAGEGGEERLKLTPETAARLRAGSTARTRDACGHALHVPLRGEDARAVLGLFRPHRAYGRGEAATLEAWIFIVEEVLRRKRAELALNEKELQLQRAQRMEALGALAGGVAHDFNNILGAVVANGEMLELFHATDAEVSRKVRAMLAAAYRGRDVVRRILHFTRREEEGKTRLRLGDLARETLNMLEPSLPPGIKVRLRAPDDEPAVSANSAQLHQVIMNLSVNAVQAMGAQGTLEFHVFREETPPAEAVGVFTLPDGVCRCCRSRASDPPPGGYVVLSVRDSGPGMDAELMRRMFSPFFSTKAPGEGTGLGLAVADGIVSAHKGRLLVHSALGKGTQFRICLPLSAGEETVRVPAVEGTPRNDATAERASSRGGILIIDDEEELLHTCREFLEHRGRRVATAAEGCTGLRLFEEDAEGFGLVLTDYHMPDITGDRIAARVGRRAPSTPIVVVTGYAADLDAAALKALGVREILEKPLRMRDLERLVDRYLAPVEGRV